MLAIVYEEKSIKLHNEKEATKLPSKNQKIDAKSMRNPLSIMLFKDTFLFALQKR